MINPFVTGLTILTWFLSFTISYQFLPFAVGTSIYLVILTLVVTPTIPRGQLPHLDDIYLRALFRCFKKSQLADPDADSIPCISAEASHLLFSLDTIWGLDRSIGPLLKPDQSDPAVVEYCSQTALERSQRVYADNTSEEANKKVALDAKEFITAHIQRIRTIPLAINPSHYLIPVFCLDSSIQTFVHFPLPLWNAVMTMTDLTIYFPAPRGAQFFFESNIIGLRHGATTTSPNSQNDLIVDIQTTISIDRNRLEKLYSEEDQYDKAERDYITKLQQEDIQLQTEEMERLASAQQRETKSRQQRAMRRPEQLVLVARVVTSYTYPSAVKPGSNWTIESQTQYPTCSPTAAAAAAGAGGTEKPFESIIADLTAQQPAQPTPLASLDVTAGAAAGFAAALGNAHPRMMIPGPLPLLFGYGSDIGNQFDVSFATHVALNVYHASIGDNLSAGFSQSQFAKVFAQDSAVTSATAAITEKEGADTDAAATDVAQTSVVPCGNTKPALIYPYRAVLRTVATANAPATLRCFITPPTEMTTASQHVPHRGLAYSTHLQKRLRDQQKKKAADTGTSGADADNDKATPDINLDEIPSEISTETFPQFSQQRTVTLTISDGQDDIVWAQGVILAGANIDAVEV